MAWYHDTPQTTLNFVLVGNQYSGFGLLQRALTLQPGLVCHGDLLHENETLRRAEHEKYFGQPGKGVEHFVLDRLSAEQYLSNKIFDNGLKSEQVIGVKLGYDVIRNHDLWDYLYQQHHKGDFCLVHVQRNPVACFVAKQQALEQNETVFVDVDALIAFCRQHRADAAKLNQICRDRAVISYHELVSEFSKVMAMLMRYLDSELTVACLPEAPTTRRTIRQRIANWRELQEKGTHDLLEFLNDKTLC